MRGPVGPTSELLEGILDAMGDLGRKRTAQRTLLFGARLQPGRWRHVEMWWELEPGRRRRRFRVPSRGEKRRRRRFSLASAPPRMCERASPRVLPDAPNNTVVAKHCLERKRAHACRWMRSSLWAIYWPLEIVRAESPCTSAFDLQSSILFFLYYFPTHSR